MRRARLRAATSRAHADLEHLSFFELLAAQRLPLQSYASYLRAWATGMAALIGLLYAAEGSGRGAAKLGPMFQACFGFDQPGGVDSFTVAAQGVATHWDAFVACLDALSLTPEEDAAAIQGAVAFFEGFHEVVTALYPYNQAATRTLAGSLNPHAGSHPVPEDPREIEAARTAAQACWRAFPYLEQRYGSRGRLYADSDGA